MHSLGWAETSNFALVRAFSDGKPEIDRWHWETKDKSWHDGHFYSVKAPGLALVTTPAYEALTAVGGTEASADLARNAREGGASRWAREGTSKGLYSDDPKRAEAVRTKIEESTPMVWALGLIGVVLPAFVLLLLVRFACGEDRARLRDRRGGRARRRHADPAVLDAVLLARPVGDARVRRVRRPLARARGAAAAPARGRRRRAGRLRDRHRVPARAGRGRPRAVRDAALDEARRRRTPAGVAAGIAPLVAYNVWAFGSPTHSSYKGAVAIQGDTGHDVVGLNDGGFFGIDLPDFQIALDLLFANKGLLTLAPILGARARRARAAPPPRPPRGGLRDRRHVPRLPHLQLGLLAAVRRRLARPALPGPGDPVPRGAARARLAPLAGDRARPGRGVRRPHGHRHRRRCR